jgi:hypothetical protein
MERFVQADQLLGIMRQMKINGKPVFLLVAVCLAIASGPASSAAANATPPSSTDNRAGLQGERLSADVHHIADWAVHSGDNKGMPFIIVDKVHARAAAFDRTGKLLRSTPILIGMGVGDAFEPGVLQMDMHDTMPSQRITPAGRYVAEEDLNLAGERVLWVDYDAGIAIHKLPAKKTQQRRHERMRSSNPADHRITYGCINVPAEFYDQVVRRNFRAKGGIVYVLPDSAPVQAVFKSYDVGERRISTAEEAGADRVPPQMQRF